MTILSVKNLSRRFKNVKEEENVYVALKTS